MKLSIAFGILLGIFSCSWFSDDILSNAEIEENAIDSLHNPSDTLIINNPNDSIMNETVNELSFLALGDSYTIGEGVTEAERWPVQLVSRLKQDSLVFSELKIIARTGWTTDELQAAIVKEQPKKNYQLVSLLIGVNNQYRKYPINEYPIEFRNLLTQAIEFAGGDTARVFVVSIPDYGVTPFGKSRNDPNIGREIDSYNTLAANIAQEYGVQYFNITDISRKAAYDLSLVASDNLHPSGKMYSEWVDLIHPWVRAQLKD